MSRHHDATKPVMPRWCSPWITWIETQVPHHGAPRHRPEFVDEPAACPPATGMGPRVRALIERCAQRALRLRFATPP